MALIETDMSEVKEVVPGSYPARITAAEVKESKSTPGNHYVQWTLEVFGAVEQFNGLKLPPHRTMTSGAGAGILKRFVEVATGEPWPKDASGFDTDNVLGREVYATVTRQKDNPDYMQISKVASYKDQEVVLDEV